MLKIVVLRYKLSQTGRFLAPNFTFLATNFRTSQNLGRCAIVPFLPPATTPLSVSTNSSTRVSGNFVMEGLTTFLTTFPLCVFPFSPLYPFPVPSTLIPPFHSATAHSLQKQIRAHFGEFYGKSIYTFRSRLKGLGAT